MRVLDLFSGLGGFAIATHLLGMETAAFVEWDPKCQRILAQRFPEVPIHGDITTLTAATIDAIGPIDVVVGGFPCQPVSVAGQRRGTDDDRWLWPEMARVIAAVRPRYVLAENTPGLVTLGLATVRADLEGLGYHVRHVEVPACATEADHERQRVWILAVAHADAHRQGQPQSVGAPAGRSGWAGDGGAAAGRGDLGAHPTSTGPNPDRGLRDGVDHEVRAGRDLAFAGGPAGRPDATSGGLRRGGAPGQAGQPACDGQGATAGTASGPDADGQRRATGRRGGVAVRESLPDCDGAVPIGRTAHGDAVAGVRRVADGLPRWLDRPPPPGITQRSADRSTRLKQLGNAVHWPVAYEILRPIAIAEGLVAS